MAPLAGWRREGTDGWTASEGSDGAAGRPEAGPKAARRIGAAYREALERSAHARPSRVMTEERAAGSHPLSWWRWRPAWRGASGRRA
jgi:hypothetical protein